MRGLGGTSEAHGASPTCFVALSGSGPNFNHESPQAWTLLVSVGFGSITLVKVKDSG